MARWEAIGDVLSRLRGRRDALSKRIDEALAIRRWDEVVGAMIAKHARPLGVRPGGILYVEVDHPAWRAELHHRKRQILEKLNATLGEGQSAIADLFFVDPRSRGGGAHDDSGLR